jgi:hypothetical protein
MIPDEVFSGQMAMVLDWCQTTLPDPVLRRYQENLSAVLSETQFRLAISKILTEIPPRASALPSIKQILEQVRMSADERGLIDWEKILIFQERRRTEPIMLDLSQPGDRALKLIGGVDALAEASLTQISFMRRDFLAYRRQLERVASLSRYDHKSLQPADDSSIDWKHHPNRKQWIAEINRSGVPAFLAAESTISSHHRAEFYRHARDCNWLN